MPDNNNVIAFPTCEPASRAFAELSQVDEATEGTRRLYEALLLAAQATAVARLNTVARRAIAEGVLRAAMGPGWQISISITRPR
jgi:hypothetical protein